MEIGLCTFASSSSGNSYLIKSETTNIILDVGVSARRIYDDLELLKIDFEDIDGILITHEHIDHVRSAHLLAKKASLCTVFLSEGTKAALMEKNTPLIEERTQCVKGGDSFMVGDIKVTAFDVSHDTLEPLAFAFEKGNRKIAVVTDTGYVSEEIYQNIKDADILVLEANHERNILLCGNYPYLVKHRILSDKGHLSNEAAANCIIRILKELDGSKVPMVLLAHLSQENNTPYQAFITVRNMLEEEGYYIGKDIKLEVVERDAMSRIMAL